MAAMADSAGEGGGLQVRRMAADAVNVLREEAVGMYEVAVLEAGSAAALKKWMDEHGYRFPDGMEDVCNDYVDDRWCFVAVKTKVGVKQDADPRPGQRRINVTLPTGANVRRSRAGDGIPLSGERTRRADAFVCF